MAWCARRVGADCVAGGATRLGLTLLVKFLEIASRFRRAGAVAPVITWSSRVRANGMQCPLWLFW